MKPIMKIIEAQYGFITERDIKRLLKEKHHELPVLVRCNSQRFLCTVEEVEARIARVEEDPRDYVRDVSVPAENFGGSTWLKAGLRRFWKVAA